MLAFIVIPGVVLDCVFSWDPVIPGAGRIPAYVGAVHLVLTAALVLRFPMRPFPSPFALKGWHFIGAWLAVGLMASCVHLWWNDGVNWGSGDAMAPRYMSEKLRELSDSLHAANDVTEVARLAPLVFDHVAANPDDWLLVIALGQVWERVGRDEEAFACYERLGREWPSHKAIAMMLEVCLLKDRGDFDAATSRAQAFIASSEGEDRATGLKVLAIVEEERARSLETRRAKSRPSSR